MELQIFYIYKTTNLINGKFYVGKHTARSLENDYLGSGKLLLRAIQKYGCNSFRKEILLVCDYEWQMNLAERIYVVLDSMSYNLCPGGKGGFGYINESGIYSTEERRNRGIINGAKATNQSKAGRINFERNGVHPNFLIGCKTSFVGKNHSDKTRIKMRNVRKERGLGIGVKNSQFNKMWITNGNSNLKISKLENIPKGFYKGRKMAIKS